MSQFKKEADHFISIKDQFQLGKLLTETPHEKTKNLSNDAKTNILEALSSLKEVDLEIFDVLEKKQDDIYKMHLEIQKVFENGGRIFLCGCGATGRLSLALETIFRILSEDKIHSQNLDKVVSFMAGGDVALIHSIEKFEDFPDFGKRQLLELGFTKNDLLISCTEGGETPFVIGATELASEMCEHKPYFLYCNPDDVLLKTVLRSKAVIENDRIKKINLTTGSMALTGSTRMQASTILMAAVGFALLLKFSDESKLAFEIEKFKNFYQALDLSFLKDFILFEADAYQQDKLIIYEVDDLLGISVLTDTTERSPTFSLYPFENYLDTNLNFSLSYLSLKNTNSIAEAWKQLLKRSPRTFYWQEVTCQTSLERLLGFDISGEVIYKRKKASNKGQELFGVHYSKEQSGVEFNLGNVKYLLKFKDQNFLVVHLILKMLLNIHSTVLMGRLNRYESNLMTFVRASNFKLIDRSIRFATHLLKSEGIEADYNKLVYICFQFKDEIKRDEPLVLKMVEEYKKSI